MFTRLAALAVLMFVGVATWIIGSRLSADAIGMGVGIVFGVLAGIPTALLLLASQRRSNDVQPGPPPAPRNAPPVIIVAGGTRQSLILGLATELGCDLVVLGTHGYHGLERLMYGSVSEAVVRHAKCPALVAHLGSDD